MASRIALADFLVSYYCRSGGRVQAVRFRRTLNGKLPCVAGLRAKFACPLGAGSGLAALEKEAKKADLRTLSTQL